MSCHEWCICLVHSLPLAYATESWSTGSLNERLVVLKCPLEVSMRHTVLNNLNTKPDSRRNLLISVACSNLLAGLTT